jgi:hypothetical protein
VGILPFSSSLTTMFQADFYPIVPYNFSAAGIVNLNIPSAIGAILGVVWGGRVVNYIILKLFKLKKDIYEPEIRLAPYILPGMLMPIGVLMYGFTTAEGMPWIIPCSGAGFFRLAIGGTGDIALTFLHDAYTEILPDALIGVAFCRNAMAMILVFANGPWFDGVGVYNSLVLLGCISVAFSLSAVPTYFWGTKYCVKCADLYRHYAAKQYTARYV